MKQDKHLPYSHLTDDEFLSHLYTKDNPTDEDLEAAMRLEHMLNDSRDLLEQIHRIAAEAGESPASLLATVSRIRELTAPAQAPETVYLQ